MSLEGDFNDLRTMVRDALYEGDMVLFEQAKRIVRNTVRKEANEIFHWLASQIRLGMDSPPAVLLEFTPKWAPLAKKTNKVGNFFLETGKLAKELDRTSPARAFGDPTNIFNEEDPPSRFFPIHMGFEDQGGIYRVEVDMFPRLPDFASNADLSLLVSEISGGEDPEVVWGKLMNAGKPGGPERPLLAPALLYFLKHRIPDAVDRALEENGFAVV